MGAARGLGEPAHGARPACLGSGRVPLGMRISVIDVGSNTVRLAVADADGGAPLPVHTAKQRLRLSQLVRDNRELGPNAVEGLAEAVAAVWAEAGRWGSHEPFALATAVVRDAPNRDEVLRTVRQETRVLLRVLPGEVKAELIFLAARRWMGWRPEHALPGVDKALTDRQLHSAAQD